MSATRPEPRITLSPGVVPFSASPLAAIPLSAITSVPNTATGLSITAWLWTLVSKPVGSTASISNSTLVACSLDNVDLPGTYLVHLKVTDNDALVSFDAWYPKQDPTTKLIETYESTAVVEIVMESEFLALEIAGSFSRNYTVKLNEALLRLDDIGGAVTVATDHSTATAQVNGITEWTADAGVTIESIKLEDSVIESTVLGIQTTSGDIGVTSADDINVLAANEIGIVTTDGTITIDANGVTSDVAITADDAITATAVGAMTLETTGPAKTLTLKTTDGNVWLRPKGVGREGAILTDDGPVTLAAGGTARAVSISTEDGLVWIAANGAVNGTVNVDAQKDVTIDAADAIAITSAGTTTIGTTGADKTLALTTTDGSITIDANGTGRDVVVTADDAITATAAGVMTLGTTGANKTLTITTTDGDIALDANVTGAANGDVTITADGGVTASATTGMWLETTGAASAVTLTTTDGSIVIDANGAGRDVAITADDAISAVAAGAISLVTTGISADVILTTQGAGGDVSITTTDGNITIDANSATREVNITAAAGALLEAQNGNLILKATTGNLYVDSNGAGADLILTSEDAITSTSAGATSISTTDGSITIDANGSGKDVTITADDKARVSGTVEVELSVNGSNHINMTTSTVAVQGTGVTVQATNDVAVTAGGSLDLNATIAYIDAPSIYARGWLGAYAGGGNTVFRLAPALDSKGTSVATGSGSLEQLAMVVLPGGYFTPTGNGLHGSALVTLAANVNVKTFSVTLDGTELFNLGGAINGGTIRIEFEIWKTDTSNLLYWWFRSSYPNGSKTVLIWEEDSGTTTITVANELDLALKFDGEAAADAVFKGWRVFGICV